MITDSKFRIYESMPLKPQKWYGKIMYHRGDGVIIWRQYFIPIHIRNAGVINAPIDNYDLLNSNMESA